MKTKTTRRRVQVGALVVLALMASACGGDDNEKKTVTAADYTFKNLPKEVTTKTVITLTNSSTKELHEFVAIRIPDGEKRSVADLLKLPEDQQNAIFGETEPATVLLAPPGGAPEIKAVGDGTIKQKGRYAIICAIPTGADPQAYLAAAQTATNGPPQVAGGPPHFTQGMFGELKVK